MTALRSEEHSRPLDLGPDPWILVSRTDRIGDLVLSLPVVRVLKNAYPHARVDFLIRKGMVPVVDGQPGVDGILIYCPDSGKSRELAAQLAAKKYNAVICLYPRPELARSFARAKIPVRIGTARRWYSHRFTHRVNISRRNSGQHEKDLNLNLLRPLGIDPDFSLVPEMVLESHPQAPEPPASADTLAKKGAQVAYKPLVVLHPGDGGSAANWRIEKYAELARLLRIEHIEMIVTGTQADREKHLAAFSATVGQDCILSGRTDLPRLMQILVHSDLFIGGSTGPLHLAAALGTPVVGLYGPIYTTTPDRWGPCGAGHTVFVPDVPTCRCKVGACRLGNCMDRIAVGNVLAAALQKLHGKNAAMSANPRDKTRAASDSTTGEGLCT